MSFAFTPWPAPGKRPGKQIRPRFGPQGGTGAYKVNSVDGARRLALRPVGREWLPPCFPGFGARGRQPKRPRKTVFKRFRLLRKTGAAKGFEPSTPNLAKLRSAIGAPLARFRDRKQRLVAAAQRAQDSERKGMPRYWILAPYPNLQPPF